MECLKLISMSLKELQQECKKQLIPYTKKNRTQLIELILNEPARIKAQNYKLFVTDPQEELKQLKLDKIIEEQKSKEEDLRESKFKPNEPQKRYYGKTKAELKRFNKDVDSFNIKEYGMTPKELRKFKEFSQEYINVLKKKIPNFIKTDTFIDIKSEYQEIINSNNESNIDNNNKRNSSNLLVKLANLIKKNKINNNVNNETIKTSTIKTIKKSASEKKTTPKPTPKPKSTPKPTPKPKPKQKIVEEESKDDDEDEEPIINNKIKPTMAMYDNDFNKFRTAINKYNKITYELSKSEEKILIKELNNVINTIIKTNPPYKRSNYKNVVDQIFREYKNIETGTEKTNKKQLLINLVKNLKNFKSKDLTLNKLEIEALLNR